MPTIPVSTQQSSYEHIPNSINLPKQLESVKIAQDFPPVRHRWNTNEEIASLLLAFTKHEEWQQHTVGQRPASGSMLLFNRNSVRYRKDGYCWKKRKDGRTIREDHMKLKVQGLECIYGSYVHSAILPTFHRRCYWLLQNPDVVLVHYLNAPYPNKAKLSIPVMSIAMEKKEWNKEELVEQLKPMFSSKDGESLPLLDETIMTLVQRLTDSQDMSKTEQRRCSLPDCKPPCLHVITKNNYPQFVVQPDKSMDNNVCQGSSLTNQTCEQVKCQIQSNGDICKGQTDVNNFTQSSLIVDLGHLGNGQVMLLTGKSTKATPQLSVLTNACTSSGQLQNASESTIMSSHSEIYSSTSICDSQNSFCQSYIQQSQSHDGFSQQCNTSRQSGEQHVQNLMLMDDINMPTNAFFLNASESFTTPGNNFNTEKCSLDSKDSTLTESQILKGCINALKNRLTAVDSNNDCPFSTNSENTDSVINLFLADLHSNHLPSDKISPMDESKQSFGHLGDSFDSLHASLNSLQGSDINLDQLDLIDMPDLERMCSDLGSGGSGGNMNLDLSRSDCAQEMQVSNDEQNVHICAADDITNPAISKSSTIIAPHNPTKGCMKLFTNKRETFEQTVSADGCCSCRESYPMSRSHMEQNALSKTCEGQRSVGSPHHGKKSHTTKSPCSIATITDFSPEWAYTDGQTKVLVTGPWHANMGTYAVLLDGKMVATTLVQPGVLRCFVPGHLAGNATLEVSCDGTVISNNVVFQYREKHKISQPDTHSSHSDWFSVSDSKLWQQLIMKLEHIGNDLSEVPDFCNLKQTINTAIDLHEMDVYLSQQIELLIASMWMTSEIKVENGSMGLSLLHLAAGLGLNKVIKMLLTWRNENPCLLLEYEVDAHSLDVNACTPLMWACARGHDEAAITLLKWNKGPLHSFNREGYLPLLVARQHGHHSLADQLELLDSSYDISHDQSSLHESFTPSSIYTTQSIGISQPLQQLCSANSTVSCIQISMSEKSVYSSDCHIASSPVITKDATKLSEDLAKQHQFMDNTVTLGDLNDEVLAIDCSEKPNNLCSQDSDTYQKTEHVLKSTSIATCNIQNSSSTTESAVSLSFTEKRKKLQKRFSVDVISNQTLEPVHFSTSAAFQRPVREANSEPHLAAHMEHFLCQTNPMLSEGRDIGSPEMLVQRDSCKRHRTDCSLQDDITQQDHMYKDNLSEGSSISFIDVERVSDEDENAVDDDVKRPINSQDTDADDPQPQMVHLAKQIIAAIPERIKSSPTRGDNAQTEEFHRERSSSYSSLHSSTSPRAASSYGETLSSYGEDSGISTPMHDGLAFDEYRYPDVYSDLGTPASSMSPDSTCLHSPYRPYTFHMDSPPPTAAEFVEYFNAPATFMEKDFSKLTLSDQEQRKLYEAAKVIQNAYRHYKDKQCKQQAKEREAAVLIQSYYRRYKQYAYYKKMTQAAVLIQSQFRSYYAQKRFKKSRDAAVVIQNQYRSYKEHERLKKGGNKSVTQRFRSHYQRKPVGIGKGSRVVQIVSDTGDEIIAFTCQHGPRPTQQTYP